MTSDQIKELRRLAEAATPSPEWKFIESGSKIGFRVRSGYQAFFSLGRIHHELNEEVRANAAYVKAANPSAVLDLIAHIEALEQEAANSVRITAAQIHYPQCWDTAAYPTLESAVHEFGPFVCAICAEVAQQDTPK